MVEFETAKRQVFRCTVEFKVLAGTGAQIDTTTANGRLIYRVGRSRAAVSDA
jgi:hypothetical protein